MTTDEGCTDCDVERVKGEIGEARAKLDNELAEESADAEQDRALRTLFHTKISEISAAGIDRSRDSAKFVQVAAAALTTAYISLLGLVFSVTGKTLPLRGVYAAGFLGLAIAMAVAYLAFLTKPQDISTYTPGTSFAETQIHRTANLARWINSAVDRRAWAMRAAVLAFGLGVAFIPAAFVGPTTSPITAASTPTVPQIPQQVPKSVQSRAVKLFNYQVDTYLAAVQPAGTPVGASANPASAGPCDFPTPLRDCGWTTESRVDQSFLWLALIGLGIIVIGASAPSLFSRRRRGSGTPASPQGAGIPQAEIR